VAAVQHLEAGGVALALRPRLVRGQGEDKEDDMKRTLGKKLTLNPQTIRNLSESHLGKIAGGIRPVTYANACTFGVGCSASVCPSLTGC
jgi:hypothetical protein